MGALFSMLAALCQLYLVVILARILMSWIPNIDPSNPIAQLLRQVTDPVLEPARQIIPSIGMIDISPIVVFFALQILIGLLRDLAVRF